MGRATATGADGAATPVPDLHADAVRTLHRWTAPDAEQEGLRAAYVDHLRAQPGAIRRSGHPTHLTASALVLSADGRRVLLNLHGKGGFWGQFGGHLEDGDRSLAAAALREAAEESGVAGLRLLDPEPVDLDRHALGAAFGACAEHLDVRFAVVAPEGAQPVVGAESRDVRWFHREALPDEVWADLGRLVRAATTRLR